MRTLDKWRRLPPARRAALPGALAAVTLVRLCLRFLPPRMWERWAERIRSRQRSPSSTPAAMQDIAWAVRRASLAVPGATCLTRALAAQILLARHGYPARLRIGVARAASDGLRAHAWLEADGVIVLGGSRVEAYTPLGVAAANEGNFIEHGGWLRNVMEQSARDWATSRAVIAVILIVPFLVVAGGLVAAALGRNAYEWFVAEDRFAETLQVIAFGAAGVFSLLTAARLRASNERKLGAVFLVIGLGLAWVVGEEISWGQRIFGWTTPDTLLQANRQAESNLHNILVVEIAFRWVQFAVGAAGTLLPFLLLRRPALFRSWPIDLGRFVPHLVLVPYFACTLLWRSYRNIAPPPSTHRYFVAEWSEVIELNLALGIMLLLLYQWRQARSVAVRQEPQIETATLSWRANEKPFGGKGGTEGVYATKARRVRKG